MLTCRQCRKRSSFLGARDREIRSNANELRDELHARGGRSHFGRGISDGSRASKSGSASLQTVVQAMKVHEICQKAGRVRKRLGGRAKSERVRKAEEANNSERGDLQRLQPSEQRDQACLLLIGISGRKKDLKDVSSEEEGKARYAGAERQRATAKRSQLFLSDDGDGD